MTVQSVPYALQNASHSAAVFRQATSAPFQTAGVLGVGELAISQQGTPNMSVVLGAGRAMVAGSQVTAPSGLSFTTQAMYNVLNDGSITLTVTAANATNPRIDAVYIGVQDAFYSGSANTAVAGIVAGTPAASPVAPAVPANSLLLGYVAIAAGATSIVTANITQLQCPAGLTGAVPSVPSLTIANVMFSSPQQGQLIYRQDTGTIAQYYAAYNSTTNPTGWQTAGWHPVVNGWTPISAPSLGGTGSGVTLNSSGYYTLSNATGLVIFDDIFWGLFDDYLVTASMQVTGSSGNVNLQLVNNGTVQTGSVYSYSTSSIAGSALSGGATTSTKMQFNNAPGGTDWAHVENVIINPNRSSHTLFDFTSSNPGQTKFFSYGGVRDTAQYTGIQLDFSSGLNFVGELHIYGRRVG